MTNKILNKGKLVILCCILFCCTYPTTTLVAGNLKFQSFSTAKKILEHKVYLHPDERITIYCAASFDMQKKIILPQGFTSSKHKKRKYILEWEHIVPVENFGRSFSAWREGHQLCQNKQAKPFKGRKCAEKVSAEFRYMQADMYNLYPSIGAVNAARSNYNFNILSQTSSDFGTCPMKIHKSKAEPPTRARGKIARAYLYMESTYPRYKMSEKQSKLMQAWDKLYPVNLNECTRTKRIEKIQGNENKVVKKQCIEHNLW